MYHILSSIITPLLSLFVLIIAQGFFLSFISMTLRTNGMSEAIIGYVHSGFYAGLIFGALKAESFIHRVGHIRTFSAMASIITVTILLQKIYFDPYHWVLFRIIAGFAYASIFVVIESWLLDKSTLSTRGRVLSLYMITFYGSQSVGQFFLDFVDLTSDQPYMFAAILTSLAMIPVCYTRAESPLLAEPEYQKIFGVFKRSPFGFVGCIFSGMIISSLYSFIPNFAQEYGLSVSLSVFATIFGGMCMQWPIGKLSDVYDRRTILFILSLVLIVPSILITMWPHQQMYTLGLVLLVGGISFAMYPLSVTQVCDHYGHKSFTSVTGVLLTAYGAGSVIGPLISPLFMNYFDLAGLYISIAAFGLLLAAFGALTYSPKRVVPQEMQAEYVAVPSTSPVVYDLDPRGDEEPHPHLEHGET